MQTRVLHSLALTTGRKHVQSPAALSDPSVRVPGGRCAACRREHADNLAWAQTPALHSLSTTGLLFYNALLSLPLLLASLLASPESAGIRSFPGLWSPGLLVGCCSLEVVDDCVKPAVQIQDPGRCKLPHQRSGVVLLPLSATPAT